MFPSGSKARLPTLGPRNISKEAMTDMGRVGRREWQPHWVHDIL